MKRLIAAAILAIFFTGCAGTKIDMARARTVKVGMSEAEITQIMGKPYSVISKGDTQVWV
jgi:outer membrane protein assembly factor BamE (lipoprotein component of BamABCDE complex)